jgi:hypothetical protein
MGRSEGHVELANEYKHSVRFTLAVSVFRDPGIRTMFDEDHSIAEERWIALAWISHRICRASQGGEGKRQITSGIGGDEVHGREKQSVPRPFLAPGSVGILRLLGQAG